MLFIYVIDSAIMISCIVILFYIIAHAIYIISVFCILYVGGYIYVYTELIPVKTVYFRGV